MNRSRTDPKPNHPNGTHAESPGTLCAEHQSTSEFGPEHQQKGAPSVTGRVENLDNVKPTG